MPKAHQVLIPRAHVVRFEDRCVGCGVRPDGGSLEMQADGRGPTFRLKVPACARCAVTLRRGRTMRRVACLVITLLGFGLSYAFLRELERGPVRSAALLVASLASLSPWLLVAILAPMPFDMSLAGESVSFAFRDAERAREFAALNPA